MKTKETKNKVVRDSAYYKKLGELRWKRERELKITKLSAKFLPILKKGGDNEKVALALAKVALKK